MEDEVVSHIGGERSWNCVMEDETPYLFVDVLGIHNSIVHKI